MSWVWHCDDSIDRTRHLGGPNRLFTKFYKRPPSPFYFQVKKPTRKMFFFQANMSTRVLLIADRVIRLQSPAHPRNTSEQRVQPSWFHLGTFVYGARNSIFVLWFSVRNSLLRGETRRFGFCDRTSGKMIFFLPSWSAPVTSQRGESSTINQGLLGASRELGALGIALGIHPVVTST